MNLEDAQHYLTDSLKLVVNLKVNESWSSSINEITKRSVKI